MISLRTEDGREIPLRVSVGASVFPEDGETVRTALGPSRSQDVSEQGRIEDDARDGGGCERTGRSRSCATFSRAVKRLQS